MTINFDYVDNQEVESRQVLLEGTRMNGYVGQDKQYGYFQLEDYGSVKLYVYSKKPYYIVMFLNERHDPWWVIFNTSTVEETELLYQETQVSMSNL